MANQNPENTVPDPAVPQHESSAPQPEVPTEADPAAAQAQSSEPQPEVPTQPDTPVPTQPDIPVPVEPQPTAAAPEVPLPELTIGAGAPAEFGEEPLTAPTVRGKVDRFGVAMGTGRRKTSVARVRIRSGDGKMTINGRSLEDYCRVERDRHTVEAPLRVTGMFGKVDVWVRVEGGGTTGQAGAMVLGIARALEAMDPAIHHTLAEEGYLTRDERMVERKKYGLKKARRSFQFSKR